jgi:3'(2'),5'-bisphosphate nucleotidase
MDAIAREAGRGIYTIWKAGCAVTTKADGSPVTIADQEAEAIICAGLAEAAAGIPVMAEEAQAAGIETLCGARFFLVDPLDGTRGFTEGGTEYTVNIGLIENGVPTHGVVYAPATGELYLGGPDGAFHTRCDPATAEPFEPRTRIGVDRREKNFRGVGSRSSQGLERFFDRAGVVETRKASSSLKFCLLASGEADLYPRFGEINEWDAAAADAVLRAAGGGMMRLNGAPVLYGQTPGDTLICGFVAYGGPASQAAARAALDLPTLA